MHMKGIRSGREGRMPKAFLADNPAVCDEIEQKVREHFNPKKSEEEGTDKEKENKQSAPAKGQGKEAAAAKEGAPESLLPA